MKVSRVCRTAGRSLASIIVVAILVATAVVILVPKTAAAQGDYPIEYGWIGWDGNSVIYPSMDSNMTYLAPISASAIVRGFPTSSAGNNTITAGLWNETSSGQQYGAYYYWDSGEQVSVIIETFYAVSGFNYSGVGNPVQTVYEIGAVNGTVALTGLGSSAVTFVKPGGDFLGLNSTEGVPAKGTGGYDVTWLEPAVDAGLTAAAIGAGAVFPPAGIAITGISFMNDFLAYLGLYNYHSASINDLSDSTSSGSNPHIVAWGADQGGSYSSSKCKYDGAYGTCGQNVFGETYVVESQLVPSAVTSGSLQVSAVNQMWAGSSLSIAGPSGVNGASVSLSYPVEPTVSIGGTVSLWPGGPPAANSVVDLQQTPPPGDGETTDIQIYTNSQGQWHYFAEPGASYVDSTVTYSNGLGSDTIYLNVPSTATSETGQNPSANTAFNNVGELQGSVTSSTTGGGIGYAEMTLTNNANGDVTSVSANSQGAYSGLFYYPASSTSDSFHLVAAASGYCPASATLTNIGPEEVVHQNLKLTPGCGGGGGCVAFGTPILTTNGAVPVQRLRPGQSIVEFNLSSGQLASGEIVSANATRVNEVADINFGALYLTPTDQPIFVRNATFEGWLRDPQNLTTSDQLLDPVSGQWVHITNVHLVDLEITVYDVITTHLNDFIASGYLLDEKGG
ncbi:MAG: carboxypeptidase-like regulatory domain-containing protein [Thermoplasmata archaeon]